MGYYHATVEGTEQTRLEQIKDMGGRPELPPLDGLERLWESWTEAGIAPGGAVLQWGEIQAYGRICGLTRDDMVTLRRMSEAYLEGMALTHPLAREPMDLAE